MNTCIQLEPNDQIDNHSGNCKKKYMHKSVRTLIPEHILALVAGNERRNLSRQIHNAGLSFALVQLSKNTVLCYQSEKENVQISQGWGIRLNILIKKMYKNDICLSCW